LNPNLPSRNLKRNKNGLSTRIKRDDLLPKSEAPKKVVTSMCAVQPLHTSELETIVGQKSLQRLLKKVYKSEVPTRCRIKLLFTVWFVRRSCLPKLLEVKKGNVTQREVPLNTVPL